MTLSNSIFLSVKTAGMLKRAIMNQYYEERNKKMNHNTGLRVFKINESCAFPLLLFVCKMMQFCFLSLNKQLQVIYKELENPFRENKIQQQEKLGNFKEGDNAL